MTFLKIPTKKPFPVKPGIKPLAPSVKPAAPKPLPQVPKLLQSTVTAPVKSVVPSTPPAKTGKGKWLFQVTKQEALAQGAQNIYDEQQEERESLSDLAKTPKELTDETLADVYGMLHEKIEELKKDPVHTQFKNVHTELVSRFLEFDPEDALEYQGDVYQIDVGMCGKEDTKVTDMTKVKKLLGDKLFMELVKVTIGDLRKYLTPEQFEEVTNTPGYSTTRSIKVRKL